MPRVGDANIFRFSDLPYDVLLEEFTLEIEQETAGEAISIRDFQVEICINPLGM